MAFSSSPSRSTTTRRVTALLATAVLVPGLAACGGDDADSTTTATSTAAETTPAESTPTAPATTSTEAEVTSDGCKSVDAPEPRAGEADEPKPKPASLSGSWTVTMTTNCGSFAIALDTKRQPKTTASFKSLVANKFYDGLFVTRIAPDASGGPYVIQAGDPTGTGAGGPGYDVVETPPADAAYTRGVVAMAKTATDPPGSSGSQFFVVTGADTGLPPDYAIVGKVSRGLDTIDRINALGSGTDGPPTAPIVISKATAKRGG